MSVASTGRTLFRGGTVLTLDPQLGDFQQGDVLVEGARIAAVGTDLHVDDAEIVDARDSIVLPGLVDAHRHAWQGTLRRLMPNVGTLDAYVKATHYLLAKFYRPEDMRVGNLMTALSCLDAGTTTIIDASHNARSPEHTRIGSTDGGVWRVEQVVVDAEDANDWAAFVTIDLARSKEAARPVMTLERLGT